MEEDSEKFKGFPKIQNHYCESVFANACIVQFGKGGACDDGAIFEASAIVTAFEHDNFKYYFDYFRDCKIFCVNGN